MKNFIIYAVKKKKIGGVDGGCVLTLLTVIFCRLFTRSKSSFQKIICCSFALDFLNFKTYRNLKFFFYKNGRFIV